jgi:hypothetical protein
VKPGPGLGLIVLAASQLVDLPWADARSLGTVPYPITDVWPSTVRFLRIDRNCTIREKDDAAGYILFDYPEGQKLVKGSVELIRTNDNEGREVTKVIISMPDLPRHYERLLLDKLGDKLREDRGSPAPPPPRKPAPPEPDAGAK